MPSSIVGFIAGQLGYRHAKTKWGARMDRRKLLMGMAALPLATRIAMAEGEHDDPVSIIGSWADAQQFAGVVSLARAGRTTLSRSFGFASVENRVAVKPTTKFAMGSVSKWFTTTAVLKLRDQGKLSLDAPISGYLPSITGNAGSKVKLVHLLSNTSGIPDRLTAALKTNPALRSSTDTAAQVAARYGPGPLISEPGRVFDYHVLNWVLVRAILERVTSRPFAELVRELVFQPANVEAIGIAENGFEKVADLAPAYSRVMPPVRKVSSVPAFAAASGSFYGDTSDLVMAAHHIFGPRLLSASSRKEMLTVRVPEQTYAIGGRVHVVDGRTWAWETGTIGGYRTHLAHDVAGDRSIALMGNTDMAQSVITDLVNQLIPTV